LIVVAGGITRFQLIHIDSMLFFKYIFKIYLLIYLYKAIKIHEFS